MGTTQIQKKIGDIQFVYITGITAEGRGSIDSPPQIPFYTANGVARPSPPHLPSPPPFVPFLVPFHLFASAPVSCAGDSIFRGAPAPFKSCYFSGPLFRNSVAGAMSRKKLDAYVQKPR